MKKIFYALTLGLLFSPLTSAQSSRLLFRGDDDFRGPVTSVRSETAKVSKQKGEFVEGARTLLSVNKYSDDGRRCEVISYKPDGTERERTIHVYNDEGKPVEREYYDEMQRLVRKQVNTFDEGGRIVVEAYYNGDSSLRERKFLIYSNAIDRLLEIHTFDANGTLVRKDVNTYDRVNKKSIWVIEDIDGRRSQQTFDLKHSEPRFQESKGFNGNGTLAYTSATSDNSPVERFESANYNDDGSLREKTSQTREFDKYRNVTKITYLRWNKESNAFEPYAVTYNIISYN